MADGMGAWTVGCFVRGGDWLLFCILMADKDGRQDGVEVGGAKGVFGRYLHNNQIKSRKLDTIAAQTEKYNVVIGK